MTKIDTTPKAIAEYTTRLRDKNCCGATRCNCDTSADVIDALAAEVARLRDEISAAQTTLENALDRIGIHELIDAIEKDIRYGEAYAILPVDRGGQTGPKGSAFTRWQAARVYVWSQLADMKKALAALKGGGA